MKNKIPDEECATDITIEVFNHCDGSCTGCLLSTLERRAAGPVISIGDFHQALDRLVAWGTAQHRLYRPVLVFGDFPWLPLETQQQFYQALRDRQLPFGVTMTLVDTTKTDHYRHSIDMIRANDIGAVFDITVDPVRLERMADYSALVRMAADAAPHLHLQILLSETVMNDYSPENLAALCRDHLGDRAISLGFTPSLKNLERRNYRYAVSDAGDYAHRFYRTSPVLTEHFTNEIGRFDGIGGYDDFMRQTFHIGPNLAVYPVAYTIWGDVILDSRNGGSPLGNLNQSALSDILTATDLQRQAIHNNMWMERGDFGCQQCDQFDHCRFHGIGAVRKLYRDHEQRIGTCYGPRNQAPIMAAE
jgi:hypothetical protein